MSAGTSREAFEAFWQSPNSTQGTHKKMLEAAWQASRKQALADAAQVCAVVCTPNLNSFGDGYNQAAIDCEKSIKELK